MRISPDELHKAEIDDSVHAITNIKRRDVMPKVFGAVAFSKAFPRTEVCSLPQLNIANLVDLGRKMMNDACSGYQCCPMLSAPTQRR
jgi:hypothetical protein